MPVPIEVLPDSANSIPILKRLALQQALGAEPRFRPATFPRGAGLTHCEGRASVHNLFCRGHFVTR